MKHSLFANEDKYLHKEIFLPTDAEIIDDNAYTRVKNLLNKNEIHTKVWDKLKYERIYLTGKGLNKYSKIFLKIIEIGRSVEIQIVAELKTGNEDIKSKNYIKKLLGTICQTFR